MLASVLMFLLLAQDAYVKEGDRVELQFRAYRDRLDGFFVELRDVVRKERPNLLAELQDRPPEPVVYGYQILPTITDPPPSTGSSISSFSHSWPITEGYLDGEGVKLERAEGALKAAGQSTEQLAKLVADYRELVRNQRTIDQYVQYNRFWQNSIASDRERFDRLTAVYNLMTAGKPDDAAAIREALGKPDVPSFINVVRTKDRVVLRVPVYTDIEDAAFLASVKAAVEKMWQAKDGAVTYSVQVDLRLRKNLGPKPGDHIDLAAHAAKFPKDGAILTTGAPSTHSVVGRYIALGPGDLFPRTIAHEFGHLLGFRDGYIRGYRDLGDKGFQILELTPAFDDIMSAPREGNVQATHFKLLLEHL